MIKQPEPCLSLYTPHSADHSELPATFLSQKGEDVAMETITKNQPQKAKQDLVAAAMRDIGCIRENNEDSIFSLVTTLPHANTDMNIGLFIVADGMGGHDHGEIASRLVIRTVVEQLFLNLMMPMLNDQALDSMQSIMVSAIEEANNVIWEYAQVIGSDMGATCTTAVIFGQSLLIAHVGDTRAYILEEGNLTVQTTDHSTVGRLVQLGQLDASTARKHPLRSQLYRSIGQNAEVEVDFSYQRIGSSTHLLLCSDGLWDMVSDEEITEILRQYPSPAEACHTLINLANVHGGEDNISVIVVAIPVETHECP